MAKFPIGKDGDGHQRRAAALERKIIRQGEFPGVEPAGKKFFMALSIIFERRRFELEAGQLHAAIAQRFGAQMIARRKR